MIANFLAENVGEHPAHEEHLAYTDSDEGFIEIRGVYQLRHVYDGESSNEDYYSPHNVSEVYQSRYLEFQDEVYDGEEDKPLILEDSELELEKCIALPLLDDMDSEDENKPDIDAPYQ